MSGAAFRTFLEGLRPAGHSLWVPKVVQEELLNRCREDLAEAGKRVDKAMQDASRYSARRLRSPLGPARLKALARAYERIVMERLYFVGCTQLDYPSVRHNDVVSRALERKKPFNDAGAGYCDTLIWETILQMLTDTGAGPVAFVSGNRNDFADKGDELHEDLRRDVECLAQPHADLEFFVSLDRFVDKHILPALEYVGDVRAKLRGGIYPGLDLAAFIENEFSSLVGSDELDAMDVGLRQDCERVSLSGIEGINSIINVDVWKLGSTDLLVSFSVDVDAEFDCYVFKGDYYAMGDDAQVHVWDADWNEHYVAASESTRVALEGRLTFDTASKQVTSAAVLVVVPAGEDESHQAMREAVSEAFRKGSRASGRSRRGGPS